MRRGQQHLICVRISEVPKVKALRRRWLGWRLRVVSKTLRKREALPAHPFSRLIGPPARTAIRHFSAQRGRETEIPPAESRCGGFQSSRGRTLDRRQRAAAILT